MVPPSERLKCVPTNYAGQRLHIRSGIQSATFKPLPYCAHLRPFWIRAYGFLDTSSPGLVPRHLPSRQPRRHSEVKVHPIND
jgi:hypothetical protein